jgi:hypothetical protein
MTEAAHVERPVIEWLSGGLHGLPGLRRMIGETGSGALPRSLPVPDGPAALQASRLRLRLPAPHPPEICPWP